MVGILNLATELADDFAPVVAELTVVRVVGIVANEKDTSEKAQVGRNWKKRGNI